MDPHGRLHTIDPEVHVLRVDKLIRRRRVPVGMWSTFADHGTVNRFQFTYYGGDHHAGATQVTEAKLRRRGRVPRGQDVVNAYGNSDEGDISAGLNRAGPAAAEWVGRVEAGAFMRAWRQAGRQMSRSLSLDLRWTRMGWWGQPTPEGPVAQRAAFGLAEFTGSEEGRGPLFDLTRTPLEGHHLPVGLGPQGKKAAAPLPIDVPTAVPLMALRIGSRMIVSVPGEMTAEMGRRLRAAVMATAGGAGIERAVISGLANEYSSYFTTPEEYDMQHYEGAATIYGRTSSLALQQRLVGLTQNLLSGQPAPPPHPFDPRNGVGSGAPPFPPGAASGGIVSQPQPAAQRLGRPGFSWQGGPRGLDRPLDRAFVIVQRRLDGRWRKADSDLGLHLLWTVNEQGLYRAEWEPPLRAAAGDYRFRVRANLYQLTSSVFRLAPSRALAARRVSAGPGRAAITLDYPPATSNQEVGDPPGDENADLGFRPASANGGHVAFLINGKRISVRQRRGSVFAVPAGPGDRVEVPAGAARDRFGNRNGSGLSFSG